MTVSSQILIAGDQLCPERDRGRDDDAVCLHPGRSDATDEMTDADSFAVLEPKADGFRNYFGKVMHLDRFDLR